MIICTGPRTEVAHEENIGEKWCFYCRKRRDFTYRYHSPIVENENDYLAAMWGGFPRIACSHGHQDGDCFPGRVREWEQP